MLLLDPLPDFGGHSHRNEFHVPNAAADGADVLILRNGGTVTSTASARGTSPRAGCSTSRAPTASTGST